MRIKTKHYILLISLLMSLCSISVVYSKELSVAIDDPVYDILKIAEMRGVISGLPGAKPYSEDYILSLLTQCTKNPQKFSTAEYKIILSQINLLRDKKKGLLQDGVIQYRSDDGLFLTELGFDLDSKVAVSADLAEVPDIRNVLQTVLQGNITDNFSYRMTTGIRVDGLNEDVWEPYRFFEPNEGFYLALLGSHLGASVTYPDKAGLGFDTYPEMALSLLDNRVQMRWGLINREWGWGRGSLNLSGTARPFDAFEGSFRIADWLNYSYLTGTLTNWHEAVKDTTQNMFTTKRIELYLPAEVKLSLSETCLWIKRFELGYINPFMITTLYQNMLGDFDNMIAGGEFEWNIPGGMNTRLYGSMFVDEMNNLNPIYWFKQVRNIFSLQGGIETAVSFIPFTTVGFQYTRLEPFFYTHYATNYPTFAEAMDTSYQNKGVNLGYYLKPDSDEMSLSLSSIPNESLDTNLTVSYIRHSGQYGCDIDFPIIYAICDSPDKHYSEKDFIDTLIEKTVIISLETEYDFSKKKIPISLSVGYSYAVTWARSVEYYYNDDEEAEAVEAILFGAWQPPFDRHTLHIGFHLYY